MTLERLYANRFSGEDRAWKTTVWSIVWAKVFSRHVRPDDALLDLGAGYCEAVNAAQCRRRIAVDLNPETKALAAPGVEVHTVAADELGFLRDGEIDVVFSSNFLEHLPTKAAVARVLDEAKRVLKPGGKLLLVGPNARVIPGAYWDYFDHHVPLTDRSLAEALRLGGFEIVHLEARFLPYTVKSRLPRAAWLVSLWLALRPLFGRVLGAQFYLVARKPAG